MQTPATTTAFEAGTGVPPAQKVRKGSQEGSSGQNTKKVVAVPNFSGNEKISQPTLEDVVAETRKTYAGPLEVGEDLMSFEIGDTITVRRFQP